MVVSPKISEFDRSVEGPVGKNGWVNLVYPDTRGIGHDSSFYEPSMVDPKLVECTRVIRWLVPISKLLGP